MARGFALVVVALAGAALCVCRPRTPPAIVALPIHSLGDSQIIVHATVNGRPMRFLLDTGSASTLITPRAAIGLGFPPHDRQGFTMSAGGAIDAVEPIVLDQVLIGGRRYRLTAHIAPFNRRALDPSLAGVLGQDFLALHDVELDFTRETLRLLPPGTAPHRDDEARVALFDAQGLIRVDGTLDGRAVAVVFDLGATASLVNPRGAPGVKPRRWATVIGSDGKPFRASPHGFAELVLGGARFSLPTLYVSDLPMFEWLRLDQTAAVIVGVDLLAGRRVVIDYQNRELRIGPVMAHATD